MMRMNTKAAWMTAGACVMTGAMAACSGPTREVTRVDPNARIDIDYRFNDVDARETYQAMVADAAYRGWIDDFTQKNGRKPVVIVGPVKNQTQDYINTSMFTTQFERELINSNKVEFVARADQRDDVRAERAQGQENSSPETRKKMKNEQGADFILIGNIADDKPRTLQGNAGVAYYQVNLEMTDLESNRKVWIGTHEIKKVWADR